MAKRKLLQILINNANIIKKKIKKLIKGDPAVKYKDDPEYQSLMRQLADIDMKARDASFELFGDAGADDILTAKFPWRPPSEQEAKLYRNLRDAGANAQLDKVLKAKPKAKGGMVKRPQMVHGGAYKGKKHSYAAGGKVNKLDF